MINSVIKSEMNAMFLEAFAILQYVHRFCCCVSQVTLMLLEALAICQYVQRSCCY